nr:fumarylacetoacetate hydrolase family protein [Clostridia bacterium]
MKLATYLDQGQERWGLVLQNPWDGSDWIFPPRESVDILEKSAANGTNGMFGSLPDFHPQGGWPDSLAGLLALEEAGMALLSRLEKHLLRFWTQADRFALESVASPVAGVTLCAPIPRPRLMWGLVQNSPSFWRNKPERRIANFMPQGHQRPIGSMLGHLGIRKYVSGGNVELGVVIGKKGRDIPVSEAMRHVAGYTVVVDGQINGFYEDFDPLFPTSKELVEHYDWFVDATGSWAGKMSDAHCVVGPYL